MPSYSSGPSGDSSSASATATAVVSLYDSEMNFLEDLSFTAPQKNTVNVERFAKTGYKFEGIYDLESNIQLFTNKGAQVPTVYLDRAFNAVVKYSPVQYRLIFEAGEGKLENTADYIKNLSYGEAVGLMPSTVLVGMELDGWFDESGKRYSFGTSPVYISFDSDGFDLSADNIKLYAKYSVKMCTVTLMYGDGTPDVQLSVQYGKTLPDLTQYLKDDGSRVVAGFGVSYNSSSLFTDCVYTDLSLYAVWKDYKYVSFVYTEDLTKTEKVFRDGALAELPEAEREGYSFDGWYSSELLSGNKITSVSFGSLASMYYAKWTMATYTVRFVADGKLVSQSTFTIEEADIFVPPVPPKSHYSGVWEDYNLQYKDFVVNAKYTPEQLKLTLMSGTDYSYKTITYGENFQLTVPKKKGYEFDGWFYNGERVTSNDGKSLLPYFYDGAVTLTAQWSSTKCQIFFESNGGTAIETVSAEYGKPYEITQIPEREGFYFGGWFDDSMINEYIGSVTPTQNMILYAKWVKSTAVYDADGLKAIANNPAGNYHLTSNINLRGEVWEPLETFSGILNGNDYKIYNFSLCKDNADLAFILKNSGTIKNLELSNIELVSTVDGAHDSNIGVLCAYNTGKIVNCSVDAVMSVNVKNTGLTVKIGGMVGESQGLITACNSKISLTFNSSLYSYQGHVSGILLIGGVVGKDSGVISLSQSDFSIDAKTVVSSYSPSWSGYGYYIDEVLNMGGISGEENGELLSSKAYVNIVHYSNADSGGYSAAYRNTSIGGVVGAMRDKSASVKNCYSYGSAILSRVGSHSDSFVSGGIIGWVESGTVSNCASSVNLTLNEGYGGYMAGIAGHVSLGGRVQNVAYYGTISTVNYSGGYFTGLVGSVEGVFTKAYFHGVVQTTSENSSDIAAAVATSGAVSKVIGNGNKKVAYVTNSGSVTNAYIIDKDYGADLLYDVNTMFEKLCLFEADIWSVNQDIGLYLISFPENALPAIENAEE